jgi:hypothetical protein
VENFLRVVDLNGFIWLGIEVPFFGALFGDINTQILSIRSQIFGFKNKIIIRFKNC